MGTRHTIEVYYRNDHIKVYVKHCYQFKKTKMFKQLNEMLNKEEIISFKYYKA